MPGTEKLREDARRLRHKYEYFAESLSVCEGWDDDVGMRAGRALQLCGKTWARAQADGLRAVNHASALLESSDRQIQRITEQLRSAEAELRRIQRELSSHGGGKA